MSARFWTEVKLLMKRLSPGTRQKGDSNAKSNIELLTSQGVRSFQSLLETAKNKDLRSDVRSAACWLIGQLAYTRAISTLADLMEDEDEMVACEAAKSVILLGGGRIQRITKILQKGEHDHSKAAAAYVLGMLGEKTAVGALLNALNESKDVKVRSHAAEALGYIGDRKAVDSLISALNDDSGEIRFWSAFALGRSGDPRAIPALKKLASSDKTVLPQFGSVKREAKEAIRQITEQNIQLNEIS